MNERSILTDLISSLRNKHRAVLVCSKCPCVVDSAHDAETYTICVHCCTDYPPNSPTQDCRDLHDDRWPHCETTVLIERAEAQLREVR